MLKTTLVIYSNGNSTVKAEKTLLEAVRHLPGIIAVTPETERIDGEIVSGKAEKND